MAKEKQAEDKPGRQTFVELVKWMAVVKGEGELFYRTGNKRTGIGALKALDRVGKLTAQWRKEVLA